MSSESPNVRTVREVMRLMSEFRFDEAAQHLHEDVIVDCPYQAFHQGPLRRGRALVAAGFQFVPMIFSSFRLHVDHVYDCPDDGSVVFEMHSEGVFAAGGGAYHNEYVMVFGFRHGKVVLWREYYNPKTMNDGMAFMLEFT
ncbi:nuclear transport factor 2 family protein [Sinimarinibacterium flocculans]|uniref:nuclear transport factor 2 family protein n=1 Tax=Sinimarinibacterium flocculans TaxID=985250 RepID=UPI002492D156|nr:nuclear transport factor 2 family protein [Sinimarinibacterium flocculans]